MDLLKGYRVQTEEDYPAIILNKNVIPVLVNQNQNGRLELWFQFIKARYDVWNSCKYWGNNRMQPDYS